MADYPRKRYSRSPSPYDDHARSRSQSRSRSRSRSRPRERSRSRSRSRPRGRTEAKNPGTGLYVSGLSTRVTERELENHFSKEGKVSSCFLVVEPRTRESRGFAFITMDNADDAERCINHLHQSVLDGRGISVEMSRRKRARTPTPGHYLGPKNPRDSGYRGDRGRYTGGRDNYGYRGGRNYSPPRRSSPYGRRYRRERSRSLQYSPNGSPEMYHYRR